MAKDNLSLFKTKYEKDFEKTNLTEDEITFIENKLKNDRKLTLIFQKLIEKSRPIHFKDIKDLDAVKEKVKLMNTYLKEEKYKIVMKNNHELKKSKDKETKSAVDRINYMILPLIVIELSEKEQKSIMIFQVFGFDSMIYANVMIDMETFGKATWINKYFGRYDINVKNSDYVYINSAINAYINEVVKEIGLNDCKQCLAIKNYKESPSPIKDPFPALHKAYGKTFFDGKEVFCKLLDVFYQGDFFELLSMISFLSLSFINGILSKEKIAPDFVLLINRNKDENVLELIKYIFGNRFNDKVFSFKDESISNYFSNQYDVESISNYITNHDNNITVLNLYYKIEDYIIDDFENNLFNKYMDRNIGNGNSSLRSNIVIYGSYEKNSNLYFNLKIGRGTNGLPSKEFFNILLFYFTQYINEEEIHAAIRQNYTNLCDIFETRSYSYYVSKSKIHHMSILTMGVELFLRFGLKIYAIDSERKDEIFDGFKEWIINKLDIHEDSNIEEVSKQPSIDDQMKEVLQTVFEEFNNAIANSAEINNSLLVKKGVEPKDGEQYIGWYEVDFNDSNCKRKANESIREVVYIERDFVDRIINTKNLNFNYDYKDMKKYLGKNKLVVKYESDKHLEREVAVYPNYRPQVLILNVKSINNYLKAKVE